ncbi:hypothetical protein Tco_0806908 [Tanacetum coccineum]
MTRNSETASKKSAKECSLNSEPHDVHAIKYKMSKAKERCMAYFRSLHSHLQVLSKDDLKGTRIEHGFKRAFMSLFGQDVDTFTRTMLLNFQKFIDSKFTLDYDSQMTDTYFVEYTGIEVQHFRDTLLQHLGNVKKSVAERTRHQRQYERRVNKRQMQTQESKIDTGKALDANLVDTESIRTDSTVQDDNSRSGNISDADDADIRPIYDEEPMAEVQLTAGCNIFAIGQQHTEQPEIINEGRVDQFSTVGLRWIPTGKLFDSCTSKVDSKPPHGSKVDIPNIHACKQTLDVSADTSINVQKEQSLDLTKGYAQKDGIDFEESFAPIAWLEADGRLFIALPSQEALYGLKQAPWGGMMEHLQLPGIQLILNGYIDPTLFH